MGSLTIIAELQTRGPAAAFVLTDEQAATVGEGAGDTVTFTLELDAAPREIEVPPALQHALDADPAALDAFTALAYTHRREFARLDRRGQT